MIFEDSPRGSTLPMNSDGAQLTHSRQGADGLPSSVSKVAVPLCDPAKYELTADMLATARGINPRNAREALRNCPVRRTVSGGGRPTKIFDVSDDLKLAQTAERLAAKLPACDIWTISDRSKPAEAAASTDDLRIAQLRAQAVKDYIYWIGCGLRESESALKVCGEWHDAQTLEITTTIRAKKSGLGGGFHERGRREKKTISVGGFSIRTLRTWAHDWRSTDGDEQAKIAALAPGRKGASGRTAKIIDQKLLETVYSLLVGSCRSDLRAALREARKTFRGDWTELSYDSWRRRMSDMDPNWAGRTLGQKGLAQHQWNHTPDISMDRSGMGFNDEWTLDDVTQDWYAVNTLDNEVFRPRLYVLMRVATRQWICAVASIDPITGDQVRAMIGAAMASKEGGIPKRITFENGAVACDDTLADLLSTLGIKVRKTSMIGGSVIRGGAPDRAAGNFPGKAVIESAIKMLHRYFIFQPGQTGSNERTDAPARLQTMKAMIEKASEEGKPLAFPTQDEMHGIVRKALNEFNDAPHGGLPDVAAIERANPDEEGVIIRRAATPNEHARTLRGETLRLLEPNFLSLFYARGTVVTVSRNGIRVQNEYYGRFDLDVLGLRGQSVHVHSNPDDPSMIYVQELDRCVEIFEQPKPGDDLTEFYRAKKTVIRRDRNLLETRMRNAIAAGSGITLETLQFTANPTPDRAFEKVAPEEFARRMASQDAAKQAVAATREHRAAAAENAGAFTDRRTAKYEEATA